MFAACCGLALAVFGAPATKAIHVSLSSHSDLSTSDVARVLKAAKEGALLAGRTPSSAELATSSVSLDLVGLGDHVHVQVTLHESSTDPSVMSFGLELSAVSTRLPAAIALALEHAKPLPQVAQAPPPRLLSRVEPRPIAWGPIVVGSVAAAGAALTLGLALEARSQDRELRADGCLARQCAPTRINSLKRMTVATDVALVSTLVLATAASLWAWFGSAEQSEAAGAP